MTARDMHGQDDIRFSSVDGAVVSGTVVRAAEHLGSVVLVHGLTEGRHEAFGFYRKLSLQLANTGFLSLRFDLRGHGESEQSYEDLTLFNAISDIEAAVELTETMSPESRVHVIGTSFGGGLAALYAALNPTRLKSLILLCPNLDYRRNWIESKDFWAGKRLTELGADLLKSNGSLPHGEFRIGRAMFHELLHVQPFRTMAHITAPTLIIHGTADSIVPHDLSERYYKCNDRSNIFLVDGADHGFSVPGDDTFSTDETKENLDRVFACIVSWLRSNNMS